MTLHEWTYEMQTRFLRELERLEPPPLPRSIVPQRSELLRLYTAFMRTPHFAQWWESRNPCLVDGAARAFEKEVGVFLQWLEDAETEEEEEEEEEEE